MPPDSYVSSFFGYFVKQVGAEDGGYELTPDMVEGIISKYTHQILQTLRGKDLVPSPFDS